MAEEINDPRDPNGTVNATGGSKTPPLEEMSVKELQDEAKKLGAKNVEDFPTKKSLLSLIENLKSKPTVAKTNVAPESDPHLDRRTQDEKAWMGKREIMMNKLWGQIESGQSARILIPIDANEKPGVVQVKTIGSRREFIHVSGAVWAKAFNGYVWMIPKGVYTEVPEQIAKEVEQEQVKTTQAGANWDINRLDPTTGRPVSEQL